jgi:chemosensory pili system protein ChpA (sensor histidine kinase/response regulator)
VGEQVAATLRDAHTALESFADGGASAKELTRCAELLHSVRGALHIASVYGAGLLAEEMEATCAFLVERAAADEPLDEGVEALSRAMVQLPNYVERIMDGGHDIPLAVLPLLNDLRAARSKPLLSESTLLLLNGGSPQDAVLPARRQQPRPGGLTEQLPKLRPQFQLGLLGWIKGLDAAQNLQRMARVAERLEAGAANADVYRLWWVVAGVIEALQSGGLEGSVALKRLLGQADREIKRLQQEGEDAFTREPPTDLISNLLFYVARTPEPGERCQAIRVAFGLTDMAGDDRQVDALRDSLAAPSPRLMKTVADAIRDDLSRIKDVLDIYVRTGMEDATELAAQVGLLRKIADTLGVLGLGELRSAVVRHSDVLEGIVTAAGGADESRLISLAADLLAVEGALEGQLVGQVRPEPESSAEPVDPDFQAVRQALLGECLVNVARVKEAMTEALELPDDQYAGHRGLDGLAEQLRGVDAGLMMLGYSRAVTVLQRIGHAIRASLQGTKVERDAGRLNRLADAIVSLEYYIETLRAGRKEPVYMLENAERSLEALDVELPVATVPDATGSYSQTLRISPEDLPHRVAQPEVEKTRVLAAPVMDVGAERPDIELLETFIEEAREEIAAINRHLPAWANNLDDREALITVRRSFHTLKGSGRMVGAQLIGEYAWHIESLLNKVISGTVAAGPELAAFLSTAAGVLPELLEQLETGSPLDADLEALVAQAGQFAAGEIPQPYAADAAPEDEPELPAAAEPASPEPPAVDPVLLDILSRETAGHLETLDDFLQASGANPVPISEAMHQACHTLHGSMTMANVTALAEVTGPLNDWIEHLYRQGLGLDADDRVLCADVVAAVAAVLQNLQDPQQDMPAVAPLAARLEARLAAATADGETDAGQVPDPASAWKPAADWSDIEPGDDPAAGARGAAEPEGAAEPQAVSEPEPEPEVEPEFDAEIAEIFTEEATEILEAADSALNVLMQDAGNAPALAELQRHLHTLKGGARMAGIRSMGDFSHDLETLLIRVNQSASSADADMLALLQASVDELHRMREQVPGGRVPPPPAELMARVDAAIGATLMAPVLPADIAASAAAADDDGTELAAPAEPAAAEPAEDPQGAPAEPPLQVPEPLELGELARDLIAGRPPEQPGPAPEVAAPPAEFAQRKEMARVDSAMLEDLLNNAGEISISHSRLKQQVTSIQFNLQELGQTVQRLQQQLRLLEMETEAQILFKHQGETGNANEHFDPLELDRYSTIQQLSRGLGETASDVNSLKDVLQNIAADTETILSQQQRVAAELQDNLMRTRMVPFDQHVPRLQRLVRQQAQETGKQVELRVVGSSGELDRQVMEKMLAPFEHMLRNAVVHGVELPAEREALGKNPTASITITFRRKGAQVLIDVADDGAGVDLERVRAKAVAQKLISAEQTLSSEELAQLILRSGLSTADELTQSAGRGIGMDVVVNEIGKLGGTLGITTEAGKGCTFTVRLPYTLAISQAFIVRVGPESFALPLPTVEGVVRLSRDEYEQRMAAAEPAVEYGGQQYRLRHLGLYLGLGPTRIANDQDRVSIILVAAGENSTALICDETTDAREIVIKPIGAPLAGIPGIAGATILGDGRIVVILDAGTLVRMPIAEVSMEDLLRDEEADLPPLALVVDDSITMRRVTQRLLERNGMRVMTAKDGLEALDVLHDHRPRIIILDVEMPRMDGYEFASRVRANPATQGLPIIMVTSRTGEKHRARAIEIGVNDYLGKPYQEHDMLAAIRGLLGEDLGIAAAAQTVAEH